MQQLRLFRCSIPYPDCVYSLAQAHEVIGAHRDHFCQGEFLVIVDESEVEHDWNPNENDDEDEEEDRCLCSYSGCEREIVNYFLCSLCGGIQWCSKHWLEIGSGIYHHEHHDCIPECCEHKHTNRFVSLKSFEQIVCRSIPKSKIISEGLNMFGKKVFVITIQERSYEEYLKELASRTGGFEVKELEVIWNNEQCFPSKRPPLMSGQLAVIAPGCMGHYENLLAVCIYYYGRAIEVIIIEKLKGNTYLCLLPEGVVVPDLSLSCSFSQNVIELRREDLIGVHELLLPVPL